MSAVDRHALLIAGQQHGYGARVRDLGGDEPFHGGDHGRHAAFHIGGPAAVEEAIPFLRLKWRRVPGGFLSRRHHIRMPQEDEDRRPLAVGGPEIAHLREGQVGGGKAGALQSLREQPLTTGVLRGDGGSGYEGLGQRESHGAIEQQTRPHYKPSPLAVGGARRADPRAKGVARLFSGFPLFVAARAVSDHVFEFQDILDEQPVVAFLKQAL